MGKRHTGNYVVIFVSFFETSIPKIQIYLKLKRDIAELRDIA